MSDFETVPVGTMEELKRVEAERDSLASHVKQQTELLEILVDVPELMGGEWESMVRDSLKRTHSTLACLKAQWQAEGAESFKAELLESTKTFIHPHIEGVHAVWLRRQAERGE